MKREVDYLYLEREQGRILYELRNAMDCGTEEELAAALNHAEEYQALKYGVKEPITVKSVLQDLFELTEATDIKDVETGEVVTLEDFQNMVFQQVETLAYLLGMDPED